MYSLSLSGMDPVLSIEDCDKKSLKKSWEGSKLVCMHMCISINDSMFRIYDWIGQNLKVVWEEANENVGLHINRK